jgi:hypothetical protein
MSQFESVLTRFQSNDFREKALAAQTAVTNFESKIKAAFKTTLLKADAQGAFSFDQEFALDSLISLRSLVISSLFSVSSCCLTGYLFSLTVSFRRGQAAPHDFTGSCVTMQLDIHHQNTISGVNNHEKVETLVHKKSAVLVTLHLSQFVAKSIRPYRKTADACQLKHALSN